MNKIIIMCVMAVAVGAWALEEQPSNSTDLYIIKTVLYEVGVVDTNSTSSSDDSHEEVELKFYNPKHSRSVLMELLRNASEAIDDSSVIAQGLLLNKLNATSTETVGTSI